MKLLITILALSFLLGAGCNKPVEQEPILVSNPNVLEEINEPLLGVSVEDSIIASIDAFQTEHIKTNDRYWQAPRTHTSNPSGDITPDNPVKKSANKDKGWNDTTILPAKLPFSVELIQYTTAGGENGYQIIMEKDIGGDRYSKSIGRGSLAISRTWDWIKEDH